MSYLIKVAFILAALALGACGGGGSQNATVGGDGTDNAAITGGGSGGGSSGGNSIPGESPNRSFSFSGGL
jgi:hypothetical protein